MSTPPLCRPLAILALSAIFSLASLDARAAVTAHLDDSGIVIDNGDGAKFTIAFPVFVNKTRAKAKIAEKSVTERKATVKYEGGGQLEIEVGADEVILKPTGAPADTEFVYSIMRIDTAYAGGKWTIGATQGDFPATKPPGNLFQGNATGIVMTNPAGRTTALGLPANTYEQLQDGRIWDGNYFQWQFWALAKPGTDRIVMKLADHPIAAPVAVAKPAPSEPVSTPSNSA